MDHQQNSAAAPRSLRNVDTEANAKNMLDTNEEVLRLAGTSRTLLDTVRTRKLSFFGHMMRHNSLQRDLIEGMVEGKQGRGRPILQWMTSSPNGLVLTS